MILPWVIGFVLFNLGPILATLVLSTTRYNVISPPTFIGADNYIRAFTSDRLFWESAGHTVFYVALSVPLGLSLAFVLAVLLSRAGRAAGVYRTAIYLPYVVPFIATAVIWLWLLNGRNGVLDYGLELLGLPSVPWLTNPDWSKPALVLVSLWTIGAIVVIYVAGLQAIPKDLYEAAEVDGGTEIQKIRFITLPLMTPTIFFTLILGVISSFQVFSTAFVITGGGPIDSTLFYMLHVYNSAFKQLEMGYASALSWMLFVAVAVLTAVIFRWSRGRVYYEMGADV